MILGQHPDIIERARAEVLEISPDGQITMDQIERMEYLEQISKEVRRYFAMNSATFFGRVQEDMEVGGYRIPKGWGAMGGIHINMRNPDVFPDPDRFDPDRFAPQREAALPPGSYVPHGDGQATHHRCPGENIVTVAVKVYLTLLLRKVGVDDPRAGPDAHERAVPSAGERTRREVPRACRSRRLRRRRAAPRGSAASGS